MNKKINNYNCYILRPNHLQNDRERTYGFFFDFLHNYTSHSVLNEETEFELKQNIGDIYTLFNKQMYKLSYGVRIKSIRVEYISENTICIQPKKLMAINDIPIPDYNFNPQLNTLIFTKKTIMPIDRQDGWFSYLISPMDNTSINYVIQSNESTIKYYNQNVKQSYNVLGELKYKKLDAPHQYYANVYKDNNLIYEKIQLFNDNQIQFINLTIPNEYSENELNTIQFEIQVETKKPVLSLNNQIILSIKTSLIENRIL